jgi:gas vesicle protein
MSENGNGRNFAAGLILGALIGAGVALLFAPQSGEDTRRLIRKKAKRLARDTRERYDDLRDKVRDRYDEARDKVRDARERVHKVIAE